MNPPDDESFEHGPRPPERTPAHRVDPAFLRALKARNEVAAVPEGWDRDHAKLPPGVTWVMYPNGDLERIGFA
jgi:hypothetical protein